MTLQTILGKGGPVVWVLLGYSVVALAIVLERMIFLARLRRPARALEGALIDLPAGSVVRELVALGNGPELRVLKGMLDAADAGVRDLARVAGRIGSAELQAMERGFRTLAVLGNTAPLLGLFGTITGLIQAFMVIEAAGGRVDAQALAGGIWEAMVTTGVGLVVALPILLLLHLLEGAVDRRAHAIRRYASLLLERLPHSAGDEDDEPVHHREGTLHAV